MSFDTRILTVVVLASLGLLLYRQSAISYAARLATDEQKKRLAEDEHTSAQGQRTGRSDTDGVYESIEKEGEEGAGDSDDDNGNGNDNDDDGMTGEMVSDEDDEDDEDTDDNAVDYIHSIGDNIQNRHGFIHNAVTCNVCSCCPLRGVRYKCINCNDYDLCEQCESIANSSASSVAGNHIRTHVFIKIRIPLPPMLNPRNKLMYSLYPTSMNAVNQRHVTRSPESAVMSQLASETEFNSTELQGLAEVWMNLAIEQDSSNGGKGIDWAVFQKCMGRLAIEKSAYITSLFRIYDSDGDGLIGFPEMVKTISVLERGDLLKKSQLAFHFYDLNGDGSITIDELRTMLLSYFNLCKIDSLETIQRIELAANDHKTNHPTKYHQHHHQHQLNPAIATTTTTTAPAQLSNQMHSPAVIMERLTVDAIDHLVQDIFIKAKPAYPDAIDSDEFIAFCEADSILIDFLIKFAQPF